VAVLAVVAVAGTKDAIDSQFWNRRDLNRAELTAPAKARAMVGMKLLEGAATHNSNTRRKPVESRFRTPKGIFLWEPCGALNVNPV
jgi:hypothetical protein